MDAAPSLQAKEKSPLEQLADTLFEMFTIEVAEDGEWLSGGQLMPIMMKCDPVVPQATLGQIWSGCAATHKGKLNKVQATKMLGFLGQVQAKIPPNPKTYMQAPLPTIVGLTAGVLDEQGYLDLKPEEAPNPAGEGDESAFE
jgi:hypothetical protein